MEFPNADAARRFLPIEIRENETIKDAWYWRRHPEDRAACDRIGTDAVRAGQSYQQEFRCFCEDGSVRWLHEDVCVETVVEGRQWRAVGVCTDITSHYQVKERMQATNRRLKRSIAETHHRVKNNLQVVAALVDMQRQEAGQPAEAQSAFERMGQHIRSLAAMHDLLTYEARSGSEHESISARAVLEKLVGLVRQTVGDRKIVARVEDVRLASRQMASLVVLVNELLSNAMKHGQGSVTLSLERRGALVRLEVCDQGPGFPARFDPLATGRTGLEIVESIGRMDLQGTLEYGTRPGGGGRVTLEFLPADPVPA
jgi:two-component sensor histidine kinase